MTVMSAYTRTRLATDVSYEITWTFRDGSGRWDTTVLETLESYHEARNAYVSWSKRYEHIEVWECASYDVSGSSSRVRLDMSNDVVLSRMHKASYHVHFPYVPTPFAYMFFAPDEITMGGPDLHSPDTCSVTSGRISVNPYTQQVIVYDDDNHPIMSTTVHGLRDFASTLNQLIENFEVVRDVRLNTSTLTNKQKRRAWEIAVIDEEIERLEAAYRAARETITYADSDDEANSAYAEMRWTMDRIDDLHVLRDARQQSYMHEFTN